MRQRIHWRAQTFYFSDEVIIAGFSRGQDGKKVPVQIRFENLPPCGEGEKIPEAATLDHDEARELMTALWSAGVRPTDWRESSSQVEAIKYHLEDMRRLVFVEKKPCA